METNGWHIKKRLASIDHYLSHFLVKVKIKGEEVSISISDNPEILFPKDCKHPSWYKEAMEWVKLNKKQLLKFWNNPDIDMYEFIMSLKRV